MDDTGLTRALGELAARGVAVPDEAARIAKSGIADAVGTMLAGRSEPVVAAVRRFVDARAAREEGVSVTLGPQRASAADAALLNGTAAHALDYDDVALGAHTSTVLMPALLAEGERLDASGADVVRAYVVGYEVWAELMAREPDAYHEKGWHPTAVIGTVAGAAAVAHVNRMDAAQCANAIALAASFASGLVANFGTMTKPLHAGRAAACAIEAVRLTQAGLVASPDAIEHRAGFLAALSPAGRCDRAAPAQPPGRTLRILESGVSIKRYPVCYAMHRSIDGLIALANEHDVRADDVAKVRATIGVTQASMLRNHAPVTGLEAKFSIEFAAASALVVRAVGLRELTDSFVARPDVRGAMAKVVTDTVDTRCPIDPVFALTDRVRIELRNGTTLDSGEIRFPRGNAKLPLTEDELRAKFMDCVARDDGRDGSALFDQLVRLDTLPRVRSLRLAA